MSFEGKNLYGQYIDYSEKKKMAQGLQVSVYRTIGPLVLNKVSLITSDNDLNVIQV